MGSHNSVMAANASIGSVETAAGPDLAAVNDFMNLVADFEDVGPFIPGDTFALPELRQVPGLKLVEAKTEKMPEYGDRDEEVYGDFDTQIKVVVHGDVAVYGSDDKSKKKLLSDVKDWLLHSTLVSDGVLGDEDQNVKVLNQDIVRSEATVHVVHTTIILDSYMKSEFLGDVVESSFNENFWYKYMNDVITEGVCYVKEKVSEDLKRSLITHIDEVAQKTPVDFHPKSNDIVRDLVHPALYPYVKGVSRVKKDAELPPQPSEGDANDFWGRPYEDSKFQWLPTPFEVSKEGKCQIKEYINNLDKALFPGLYRDLEQLFETFLPYFEEVWSYAKAMTFFAGEEDAEESAPPFVKEPVSFKGQELQIIPKIVEYQLQPDQSYEGVWHAEGMSHENIVMTGIYFLDRSQHMSGGDLRFKRAFTVAERNRVFWEIPQSRPHVVNNFASEGFVPLGRFPTEEGFLLVFPNCHVHKIAKIINNSAEAVKRRIVVFFFVNPEKKIVSTREVAPQQNVIPLATAKELRLELMAERKYDKEKLNVRDIELCEH